MSNIDFEALQEKLSESFEVHGLDPEVAHERATYLSRALTCGHKQRPADLLATHISKNGDQHLCMLILLPKENTLKEVAAAGAFEEEKKDDESAPKSLLDKSSTFQLEVFNMVTGVFEVGMYSMETLEAIAPKVAKDAYNRLLRYSRRVSTGSMEIAKPLGSLDPAGSTVQVVAEDYTVPHHRRPSIEHFAAHAQPSELAPAVTAAERKRAHVAKMIRGGSIGSCLSLADQEGFASSTARTRRASFGSAGGRRPSDAGSQAGRLSQRLRRMSEPAPDDITHGAMCDAAEVDGKVGVDEAGVAVPQDLGAAAVPGALMSTPPMDETARPRRITLRRTSEASGPEEPPDDSDPETVSGNGLQEPMPSAPSQPSHPSQSQQAYKQFPSTLSTLDASPYAEKLAPSKSRRRSVGLSASRAAVGQANSKKLTSKQSEEPASRPRRHSLDESQAKAKPASSNGASEAGPSKAKGGKKFIIEPEAAPGTRIPKSKIQRAMSKGARQASWVNKKTRGGLQSLVKQGSIRPPPSSKYAAAGSDDDDDDDDHDHDDNHDAGDRDEGDEGGKDTVVDASCPSGSSASEAAPSAGFGIGDTAGGGVSGAFVPVPMPSRRRIMGLPTATPPLAISSISRASFSALDSTRSEMPVVKPQALEDSPKSTSGTGSVGATASNVDSPTGSERPRRARRTKNTRRQVVRRKIFKAGSESRVDSTSKSTLGSTSNSTLDTGEERPSNYKFRASRFQNAASRRKSKAEILSHHASSTTEIGLDLGLKPPIVAAFEEEEQ